VETTTFAAYVRHFHVCALPSTHETPATTRISNKAEEQEQLNEKVTGDAARRTQPMKYYE